MIKRKPGRELIQCIAALNHELEVVQANPSRDLLHNLKFDSKKGTSFLYTVERSLENLTHADLIKGVAGDINVNVELSEADESRSVLSLDKNCGDRLTEIELEWCNDFVLRRLRDALVDLSQQDEELPFVERLCGRKNDYTPIESLAPYASDFLNPAQQSGVARALAQPLSFIWGPPGTGKSATLGFIAAEFLRQGKRVLLLSNTNRAVDVACLSVINTVHDLALPLPDTDMTRFGDLTIQKPELVNIHFELELEDKKQQLRNSASQGSIAKLQKRAKDIDLNLRLEKITGKEAAQELEEIDELILKFEESFSINEAVLLKKKQLVATTLAKLATSDLLGNQAFDVVIVDESSMVSMPYAFLAASKAGSHLVFAGDPMQLPPISVASDFTHRDTLEKDIFLFVSDARSPEQLFAWHDNHAPISSFFDTQYRMTSTLAEVISHSFYQGRLRTGTTDRQGNNQSITFLDTSSKEPLMENEKGLRAFNPNNAEHQRVVNDLVYNLVTKEGYRPYDIGLVTPFRHNVYTYGRMLRDLGLRDVEIGTIHTFQGQEKPIMIFDTVVSDVLEYGRRRSFTVRPFDESKNGLSVPRLLNVALSRCQERLYVVANLAHFEATYKGRFILNLLHDLKNA